MTNHNISIGIILQTSLLEVYDKVWDWHHGQKEKKFFIFLNHKNTKITNKQYSTSIKYLHTCFCNFLLGHKINLAILFVILWGNRFIEENREGQKLRKGEFWPDGWFDAADYCFLFLIYFFSKYLIYVFCDGYSSKFPLPKEVSIILKTSGELPTIVINLRRGLWN